MRTDRVPWHSAAQNIRPSIPEVVPAPFGATVCTYPPVLFSSDDANVVHSGAGFLPGTRYTLPVNFAGARGPIGGLDHSPREYILVSSIVPRTALLALLMLRRAENSRG